LSVGVKIQWQRLKQGQGIVVNERFTDIISENNLEETLEQSQRFLMRVLDIVPNTVYVIDLHTSTNLFSNRSITEDLGYTPEEVQAFGSGIIGKLIHPEDLLRYHQHLENIKQLQDGENAEFEYRMRHRKGQWRWFLSRDGVFSRTPDGAVKQVIGSATEITSRHDIEDRLQASENRYRTLFNSIDQGFGICEMLFDETGQPVDYRFIEVNAVFEKQRGLRDSVGRTALELLPDLEPHWFELYGRLVSSGQPLRLIDRSETMNRWFDVYATRVGEAEDHRFAILSKDITEAKLAEMALKSSEEFNRTIFESSPDCVKVLDATGHLLAMNTQGTGLMEIDNFSPFIGRHWSKLWPEVMHKEINQALETARQGGIGAFQGLCPTDKGTPKWWDVVVSPVLGSDGTLNRLISVSRDITERRRLEIVARDALERLELGLASAQAGWWEWDLETNEHRWSAGFEQLLGLPPGSFLGGVNAFLNLIHPDDAERIRATVTGIGERGFDRPTEYEYRVLLPNAQTRWVISRSHINRDENGKIKRIMGVDLDITERKLVEEYLREINEAQKRFVSDSSHELRAPLTSIQGNLEILSRFPNMLEDERQQSLRDALAESHRMSRLVTDLLAIARGEASHANHQAVQLETILNSAWRTAQTLSKSNRKRFELGPIAPVIVRGDADQIKQLALILLENAIKYTPDYGSIRFESRIQEQHVEFVVSDTGVGIPIQDQPRVFDRFYRAGSAHARIGDPGGSGLGLTIAKRIAESHGGTILLSSTEGQGTTVTVRLAISSQEP
jgi:PAS domain S-box-containing protein